MIRRKPRHSNNLRSGYVFNCEFEERRALKFLMNLINSKFLTYKPVEIFRFTEDLVGEKSIIELLQKTFPEVLEDKDSAEWIRYSSLHDYIPLDIQMKFLKEEISNFLSERMKRLVSYKESGTEKRLSSLAKTFNLTYEEIEIISFFFMVQTSEIFKEHLGRYIAEFINLHTFKSHGDILLGLKRGPFLNAIRNGNLFKSQILDKSSDASIDIMPWCSDYIAGIRGTELKHEFFTKENNETLSVDDFDVSKDELNVIDVLIKSKGPMNLLIYGSKGTGKSSFARSLALKYKKELLTVKIPEDDNHKDKLRAIHATVNLADIKRSIVLIDEADEILNTYESLFFKSKVDKSWINNFLDFNKKKIIWITNRISEIDESTMRRFSFSLQFKKFDSQKRLKVIKYELNKIGMQDYFTEDDLTSLCKNFNVDAAGIVNAFNVLKVTKRMKKQTALKNIKTVLRNHEKITGGKRANENVKDFSDYSLEGLNTSCDLKNIISVMERYIKFKDEKSFQNIQSITALLYGIPGSGKTAFVYNYLGNLLDKKVILKRCSEIQSKWVGETEKNIASAFQEAQEDDAILFFDEADSFLHPRTKANHSWEKNFTNEILTQIESFKGIVIFATNYIDGLDHAASRRFKFKIEFRPLTPEGNLNFYNSLLRPLVQNGKLSENQILQIKGIKNLTPGDFAVIRDQTIFLEAPEITHEKLIESLINEVSYKSYGEKVIGFSR